MDIKPVYPTQRKPLQKEIDRLLSQAPASDIQGHIHALVVPYSNRLAHSDLSARVFRHIEDESYHTVIIIAPSRTGAFKRIAICSADVYSTPLGDLTVNGGVRDELCDEDDDIFVDDSGHFQPVGVDVQLPFLQTLLDDFQLVPIVMGEESPDFCRELGHAVGEVMYNRSTLLVCCLDIKEATQEDLDELMAAVEGLREADVMKIVNSGRVKLRGHGALLVAMMAARHRRADTVRIIEAGLPEGETPGRMGAVFSRG